MHSAFVRLPRTAVLAVLALTALALAATWRAATGDPLADTGQSVGSWPWTAMLLAATVPAAAVLHFLFAGAAVRAASGARVPLRTATYCQLAAAAANRLVPNGVGGLGVNVRYLRRSGISTAGALTALGGLSVVGGFTDAIYAAAVGMAGPLVGVRGARHEMSVLTAHGLHGTRHVPWAALVAVTVTVGVVLLRHRLRWLRTLPAHVRDAARELVVLCRRPRRVLGMTLASTATTVVLSAGFAATVQLVGHGHPLPPVGALLAIYLVAAALGGAAPVPAVAGVTEGALVAALTLAAVPFATAVLATVVFRAVTFWLPVPLGVIAARRLRAQRLL